MCSAARLALEILVSTNKPRGPTQSPTSLNLFFDCYGNYDHWDQSLALSHFLLLTTSNSLVHMCLLKFMCHYYFSCGSSSKTNKVLLLFVQQHLSKTSIQDFNPRLQSKTSKPCGRHHFHSIVIWVTYYRYINLT